MSKTLSIQSKKILVQMYRAAKASPTGAERIALDWLLEHAGMNSSKFYKALAQLEREGWITRFKQEERHFAVLCRDSFAEAECIQQENQKNQILRERLSWAIIILGSFLDFLLGYRWITTGWPYIIYNPNENNQVSLIPTFDRVSPIVLLSDEKNIDTMTGMDDPQFYNKILPDYRETCPKALQPCSVYYDTGEGERQEVHFTIQRNYPGPNPIAITGLRVKLIGVQPAVDTPANLLVLPGSALPHTIPVNGGIPRDEVVSLPGVQTTEQQHPVFFSLEVIPGLNTSAQIPAGTLPVGFSQVLPPLCSAGAQSCSIALESGGSRDAVLILPNFATTPLGRYQLEISVLYNLQGDFEANDRFRVEMYRPKNAQKWLWSNGELVQYSILTLENNQEYFASDQALMSEAGNDQHGRLILHAYDGMHYRDFIYDLHSGSLFSPNLTFTREGISDSAEQEVLTSLRSPDGMKLAVHVQRSRSQYFDLDLGVIDYTDPYPALMVLTSNTPGAKDFWPAWSPSSSKIAFLKTTLDTNTGAPLTDLYVYNLKTKKETRVSVSPHLYKARPVWVGENHILAGFPDPGSSPSSERPAGGYAIFDLRSGEMVWLPEAYRPETQVRYLPGKDAVQIGRNLYDPQGNQIETLKIKNGCQLMPYASDYYACDTGDVRKIYHYPNPYNPVAVRSGPVNKYSVNFGSVPGGGFVTLDMKAGMLHQYNEDGTWLRDWRAPVLTRFGDLTKLTELVLIPE